MTGKRLEGKVAVITGATRGIGYSTAELFVEHGAQVVLAGRTVEQGEALSEKLGENAVFIRTDVTREGDIKAMIDTAVERFGRLDCLFNNAGSHSAGESPFVDEISLEDFEASMSMLLSSAFLGMKYAVPIMKRQGSGSIINNASISGSRPSLNLIYSTAKAGMIQMGKGSAMALAQFGVRVNSVSPGPVATGISGAGSGLGPGQDDRIVERVIPWYAERMPLRRAGLADDVAYGVLYLASDESSFVTGHDLLIDSGLSLGHTFDERIATQQSMRETLRGGQDGVVDGDSVGRRVAR